MTAHASRLPVGLAALIAEAKHRMRRRRSLVALGVVIVGVAAALLLAFRPPSGQPGIPHPLASSLRVGELTVSAPEGFRRYTIRGGIYPAGTRAPVIGYLLTND